MKKIFIFLVLVAVSSFALAQNVNLSNKLMQEYESCRLKALEPNSDIHAHLWLTPLLKDVRRNWNELTPEAKEFFSRYEGRPTYEGTEWVVTYGNFAFHYSTDGPDEESVDDTDEDGNGIPDYVDMMAEIFVDEIYYIYHEIYDFAIPPSDGTIGGDGLFDVYISGAAIEEEYGEDGGGVYGFVAQEDEIGDNPNSNLTEIESCTCYMVMRNNYDGFSDDEETCVSVTAAHEYMHAIQNGYSSSMESWFTEMCATWAEAFVYPEYANNFMYIIDHFENPDISLAQNDDHWYSTWIFAKYLTEQSDDDIINGIYERCIEDWATTAIDDELAENYNSDLEEVFINWIITNYLITESPYFSAPYTYEQANDYINYLNYNQTSLKIEYEFEYDGINDILVESDVEGNETLMPLSADYFMMESTDNFEIELEPEDEDAELSFYILCVKEDDLSVDIIAAEYDSESDTQTIRIDNNDDYDYYIPIVIRLNADADNLESVDYTLFVSELTPTNVENEKTNTFVNIYPVPASDIININTNADNLKYELYDNTGRIIGKWDNNENSIDVSNFAIGNYTMKVSQNGKPISFKKISIVR